MSYHYHTEKEVVEQQFYDCFARQNSLVMLDSPRISTSIKLGCSGVAKQEVTVIKDSRIKRYSKRVRPNDCSVGAIAQPKILESLMALCSRLYYKHFKRVNSRKEGLVW
jgi:hypothetical protein